MNLPKYPLTRRRLLQGLTAAATMQLAPSIRILAANHERITRYIPRTGEHLPVIGVGSSRTFDISTGDIAESQLVEVLQAFFDNGGQIIDSSPMYGNAETVIGELMQRVETNINPFYATKVWTDGRESGIQQMNQSMRRMGVEVMDLMQIHNLRDWRVHIQTLREWQDEGRIRYTGITTSHGRDHKELAGILKTEELDFVQFTYNIMDRAAEETLFPVVRDRGMATLINVPFRGGRLFSSVQGRQLPEWAAEFDCNSWGQFFLKFIASHPDVTCVIPATSRLSHMLDNMGACYGRLPEPDTRQRMIRYMESL